MRRILEKRVHLLIASAASLMLACAAQAFELEMPNEDSQWIMAETANFTVVSNADGVITRRAAQSLEQLREVLVRQVQGVPAETPVPNSVYVFDFFTDVY